MEALPRLIVITDWRLPRAQLFEAVAALAPMGPSVAVQLRAPGASGRQLWEDGRAISDLLRPHGAALFVNGRLDVALALDAHLHLPGHSLHVAEARRHLPAGRRISVAIHPGETSRAVGADLALVSPVWSPGSKPEDTRPPLGPEGFQDLARALSCPAYALGGVTASRAATLGPAAAGVAVVSAVLQAPSPREAAIALLRPLPAPSPTRT